MNLTPLQPMQRRSKRPQHQRTPSSDHADVQERPKPQASNLLRLRLPRSQPSMTTCQLRHLFNPTLHPPKLTKVSSLAASRAATATKLTLSLWRRTRV